MSEDSTHARRELPMLGFRPELAKSDIALAVPWVQWADLGIDYLLFMILR